MPDASASLRERVLKEAVAIPSPTRAQGRARARVLTAASIAVGALVFERMGGMEHGARRPLGITLALAGGWTVVSAALTWAVMGKGPSSMSRGARVIGAAVVAAPVSLFAWTQLLHGTYVEPYQAVGVRCLLVTLVVSALPLASFLSLRRAAEPRHPGMLGAGAGAACAAWAGVLVDLWCPLTAPRHVLVGHVAPLVVAIGAGALAGRVVLRMRRVGRSVSA